MSEEKPRNPRSVQYLGYSVDGQSYRAPTSTDPPNSAAPWGQRSGRWILPAAVVTTSLILIVAGVATARHPEIGPPTVGTVHEAAIDLKQGAPLEIKAGKVLLLVQRHGNAVSLDTSYLGSPLTSGTLTLSWGNLLVAQNESLHGSGRLATAFSQLPSPSAPIHAVWTTNGVPHQATTSLANAYHMQVVQGRLFTGVKKGFAVAFQEQVLTGPGVVHRQGTLSIHYSPANIPKELQFTLYIQGQATSGPYLESRNPHTVSDSQLQVPSVHPIHPIINFRWNRGLVSIRLHPQNVSRS